MKGYLKLLKKQGMVINGQPRYIGPKVVFDDFNLVELGDRTVISDECHFLTHDYSFTTALISINKIPATDIAIVRGIKVGKNVFVGKKSIIMPNTTIGDNVIIGAGSVVRGKIPSDSIVIGNPCEVIGKLSEKAIQWEENIPESELRVDKK